MSRFGRRAARFRRHLEERARVARRHGRHLENVRTDLDAITDRDRLGTSDATAVHERAVLAPQIDDFELPVHQTDERVVP